MNIREVKTRELVEELQRRCADPTCRYADITIAYDCTIHNQSNRSFEEPETFDPKPETATDFIAGTVGLTDPIRGTFAQRARKVEISMETASLRPFLVDLAQAVDDLKAQQDITGTAVWDKSTGRWTPIKAESGPDLLEAAKMARDRLGDRHDCGPIYRRLSEAIKAEESRRAGK